MSNKLPKRFSRRVPLFPGIYSRTKFNNEIVSVNRSPGPHNPIKKRVTKSKCAAYFNKSKSQAHTTDRTTLDKLHHAMCLHNVILEYFAEYDLVCTYLNEHNRVLDDSSSVSTNIYDTKVSISNQKKYLAEKDKRLDPDYLKSEVYSLKSLKSECIQITEQKNHMETYILPTLMAEGNAYIDMYNRIYADLSQPSLNLLGDSFVHKYLPEGLIMPIERINYVKRDTCELKFK